FRADGRGAVSATTRPVPERPALDPRYAFHLEEDGALLVDERGHAWIEGAIFAALVPRLRGRRTVGELVRDVSASHGSTPAEVVTALVLLADAGYFAAAPEPKADGPALASAVRGLGFELAGLAQGAASVDLVSAAAEDPRVGAARRALGIPDALAERASLTLVVADDLLAPALAGVEAWLGQAGRPWLLVQPFGYRPTLGPVFGARGCDRWRHLADALRPQRAVERSFGVAAPRRADNDSVRRVLDVASRIALDLDNSSGGLRRQFVELDLEASRAILHPVGDRAVHRPAGPFALRPRPKIRGAAGGSRTSPVVETLNRLRRTVSPVSGPLRSVTSSSDDGPMLSVRAVHGLPGSYRSWPRLRRRLTGGCAGKGRTAEQAEVSGLAEALERYAGFHRPGDPTIRGRLADLGTSAIDPRTCLLISDRQYRDRDAWNVEHGARQWIPEPFDPAALLDWTPVYGVRSGRRRLLPRDWLYYDPPSASPFFRADSNGCAAGNTVEEARKKGDAEGGS
ncbi:MAG: YcaO-like family protein, partial [Acidobacteriota bacterium]